MKNLGQVTENQDIARKQDIPTNTNQLTNGAGFITNSALSGYVPTSRKVNGKALSGDISLTASDVGALPSSTTLPTVNNGTLTIQKNGANVATFTANQSSNSTANITVPTKLSDLTDGGNVVTDNSLASVLANYLPLSGGTLTGDIKMKQVGSNPSNTFGSEFYFFNCYAGGTSPYGFGLYQWIDNFQFTTRNSANNAYIATVFEISGATGITDFKTRPTVVGAGVALSSELPTKTSQLTNDSGFITSADLPSGGGVTSVVGQTGAVTATQIKSGIQSSTGGFSIGTNANASSGGAIGNTASAVTGGAVGKNSYAESGGAIGEYATTGSGGAVGDYSKSTTGGAVGVGAEATTGGAIGENAYSESGGAVGYAATANTGFAGGNSAAAIGAGSVQLGEGTNHFDGTLQFKTYQLLNSAGNIPKERLSSTSVTSVIGLKGDVTTAQLVAELLTGGAGYGEQVVNKKLAAKGGVKYKSGLIINWGRSTETTGTDLKTVNFEIPFSTTNYAVVLTTTGGQTNGNVNNGNYINSLTTGYFTYYNGYGSFNTKPYWLAIGY